MIFDDYALDDSANRIAELERALDQVRAALRQALAEKAEAVRAQFQLQGCPRCQRCGRSQAAIGFLLSVVEVYHGDHRILCCSCLLREWQEASCRATQAEALVTRLQNELDLVRREAPDG
jgi:hypothetical protein